MPAPARCSSSLTNPHDEAVAELRQLTADLRDAARDGQMLADRYAELLRQVVREYCSEFEIRAEAALARLEATR